MKNSTWNKGVRIFEYVVLIVIGISLVLGVIRALGMITVYQQ